MKKTLGNLRVGLNNIMNNQPEYQTLSNKPIGCIYCGATVIGKVSQTNQGEKQIRWQCDRCGNLVRVGKV
jgi:hypothetical protein